MFLGHKIDGHGIHPISLTLDAIARARVSSNVTELRSFNCMVNHYGRFIKQLFTKIWPLHNLLCSDVQWHWGKQQSDAFSNIGKILSSPPIVVHFDPSDHISTDTEVGNYA